MIKLIFCVHRLPHLSRDQFQRYWFESHGPLVRRHGEALHIRRYVQVHTLEDPINEALRAGRGTVEPYDGVAELWWDSSEDLQAAISTPQGQQAGLELLEDERRFIDLSRSTLWIGQERPVIEADS